MHSLAFDALRCEKHLQYMDRYIIHEIRTSDGIYQIDYESLANLPDLVPRLVQGTGVDIVSLPSGSREISISQEIQENLGKLMNKVFPITTTITSSSGFGVHEEGDIVTPTVSWIVTRDSEEITSYQATPIIKDGDSDWVYQSKVNNLKTYSPGQITTETSIKILIQSGSYNLIIGPLNVRFTKYRYYGILENNPGEITENLIKSLSSAELSTSSTLSTTELAPGKYFLFACPGTVSLVVRHSGTDAIINSTSGTIDLHRQNGTPGVSTYSWILVPASGIRWSFIIKNT